MKRRDFIAAVAAATAWPFAVRAQQPAKMKRIALVSPATKVADMNITGNRVYRALFKNWAASDTLRTKI